jgi:cytochrome c oxidase subunit 4
MPEHVDVHDHGPGPEHQDEHEHQGHVTDHVVPVTTYIFVFLALMVGTGVTVAASYVDLGLWNTPVAMLIAVTKASLVMMFFMHLKYSPKLFWVWVGAAVFFLVLLLTGTGSDYLARAFLNLGNPGT